MMQFDKPVDNTLDPAVAFQPTAAMRNFRIGLPKRKAQGPMTFGVVQNVLNRFRTISADWLVLDVGPMYRKQGIDSPATMELPFDKPAEAPQTPLMQPKQPAPQPVQPIIQQKTVQKIAIFYTDGTFEER